MRTAILISGRGSNMQALLDLPLNLQVTLIVSSKASAQGLIRARRQGIPSLILEKKIDYTGLTNALRARGIQRLVLAGFMKVLPADFVSAWADKIINIHPSLLPAYPGLGSFENSHRDFADMGVTLHKVTAELDGGPKIRQVRFYKWTAGARESISLNQAQAWLSFTEQRLVREVSHLWK